jgi:hypothetical protein
MKSRVLEIVLVEDFAVYADVVGTYRTLNLDVPELEGLLPHAETIWVESLLTNCANAEIGWNIDAYVGFDRDHEIGPQKFFTNDLNTADSLRTDANNFTAPNFYRRHARLVLKWTLASGVTSPKQGKLSAVLFVKLVGV